MKFIAIIFSVYIVYLVTVPCIDAVFHATDSVIEHTSHQGNACNHGGSDACSPFCVCSCCGVVVV